MEQTVIELIKQPTWNTCTSACLAMITGLPVSQVIDEFHETFMDKDVDLCKHNPITYLCGKGYKPIINCNPYDSQILGGCIALLTVPSLNLEGKSHSILYDNIDPDNRRILDPSNKLTYNLETLDSWTVDFSLIGYGLESNK